MIVATDTDATTLMIHIYLDKYKFSDVMTKQYEIFLIL